jgi:hypothetical protein
LLSTLLRSKLLSSDDIAVIRSSNMDIRSFQIGLEIRLVCFGKRASIAVGRLDQRRAPAKNRLP